MGHVRLGVLPKYPRWKSVIALLDDDKSEVSQIADKILDSSRGAIESESAQSSVGYCVWLIAQITLASKGKTFKDDLLTLGIRATDETNATEFIANVTHIAAQQLSGLKSRNALNNIAGLALRETLARSIGTRPATLFGAGLAEVQDAIKKYSTQKQFSSLLHIFFTAFLSRVLRFVVDKELANHVGPGQRFEGLDALEEFAASLERFSGQTSRIVDQFAGGWYSKRIWQQGAISEQDAAGFVHVALSKLSADLSLSEAQQ